MHRCQTLPRLWLMTDERQQDLPGALRRLPQGAGIVFRHYGLEPAARFELLKAVQRVARRRRLVLVVSAPDRKVRRALIDGWHGIPPSQRTERLIRTASAHDLREIRRAERFGADLVFLSPAFATRSHPGTRPLGLLRFMLLARQARIPVIALGGMNILRARRLGGIHGWAGIDAWSA